MAKKTVKLSDLQTATAASIKAVLGKQFIKRPGVLTGIWISEEQIAQLSSSPTALARQLASRVSVDTGIKVKAATQLTRGGVTVGYIQPKIMKE